MDRDKNLNALQAALPTCEDHSDEETIPLEDSDTLLDFELEQAFSNKYKIASECAISLQNDYVLSLCSDSSFSCIAAGLSNGAVSVFNVSTATGLQELKRASLVPPQSTNICSVRFLDDSANLLLVADKKTGFIELNDLRSNQIVSRFEDTKFNEHNGASKEINCFDRNANSRIICAGTLKSKEDIVFMLFYDVRRCKQLGGYFASHSEDITALRFHAENPDLLCSGSVDGLINIYDISEDDEDDALQNTINTEGSVQQLNWHKDANSQPIISCITHTDVMIYDCNECDLIAKFSREEVTKAIKRSNSANCNLINVHNMSDNGISLLAGTNIKKGEVLRSVKLENKCLLPQGNFVGNKQIIRDSLCDPKTGTFITAGESGIITMWTPQNRNELPMSAMIDSHKLKSKSKQTKKIAPY